jgi:hypothetical protein
MNPALGVLSLARRSCVRQLLRALPWGEKLGMGKGAGGRTKLLVAFSLLVLVSSTVIVGYGNYVGGSSH